MSKNGLSWSISHLKTKAKVSDFFFFCGVPITKQEDTEEKKGKTKQYVTSLSLLHN